MNAWVGHVLKIVLILQYKEICLINKLFMTDIFINIKKIFVSAYLRPSRELLEYYRKKIADYDNDRDDMTQKLDMYKSTYEEQVIK